MEQETEKLPVKQRSVAAWVSLILYFIAFILFSTVFSAIVYALLKIPVGVDVWEQTLIHSIGLEMGMLAAVVISNLMLLRLFDHRPWSDIGLSIEGRWKDILYGMLVAVVLYGIGFVLLLALGQIEVTGFRWDTEMLVSSWLFFVLVALCEEMMMRGYVLGRLLRTRLNKFLSLFISSVLFALIHIFNPNVALLPMINLVLAGMLLGVVFLYTRNLWFSISLHLFWNWIQGPILGFEVSGTTLGTSILALGLPQQNIINGGSFGFEGSIVCTVLMIIFIGAIILWFERKKQMV